MPSFGELLIMLRLFGRTLEGRYRRGYGLTLWTVIVTHKTMVSRIASGNDREAHRDARWENVQAQLRLFNDYLVRAKIKLPEAVEKTLQYYCRCSAPEGY